MAPEPLYSVDPCDPPYEFVNVEPSGDFAVPKEFRDRILIHTVHDGASIPREFIFDEQGRPRVDQTRLERRYIEERDWGANLVAKKIASAMGLKGYARCRLARVLLDFNRFPGSTPHDEVVKPLETLAINNPFSRVLDHTLKVRLLEQYYDRISDIIETKLLHDSDRIIMIAVHTYDEHNRTMTRRPHCSLLSSVLNYQRESRMPFGIFDPMYPDILGESTCSRILRDRISLTLERKQYRVSHNHPYPLPEGSMEVRAQVWFFFDYLRQRFEAIYPETHEDPAFERVWQMLLNTNLRMQDSEMLRSYLHRFRRVSERDMPTMTGSIAAYAKIERFLEGSDVTLAFRRNPDRPSSLGLEVRKDLVCTFDKETGVPMPTSEKQVENATEIGENIAEAIKIYFETDYQYL
jgi:N-formylglutamate amidohydrolase